MKKIVSLANLLVFCGLFCSNVTSGYYPIIFMHGLLGNSSELDIFEAELLKRHPNTNVTRIELFNGESSLLTPMWNQAENVSRVMLSVMQKHPDGVHLLCYSQGGLLCRGILETLDSHNVRNYISLSAPQAGQFGDTSKFKHWVPSWSRRLMYEVFYSEIGQNHLSIANYWNDPYHQDLYKKYSNFLAVLNNESTSHQQYDYSPAWRDNFLRINNLVLIGGPDDDVITPWQSALFGSYRNNDSYVIDMKQQSWYVEDSFGLKTLNDKGKLHTFTVPGVKHVAWHTNITVLTKYLLPWLD